MLSLYISSTIRTNPPSPFLKITSKKMGNDQGSHGVRVSSAIILEKNELGGA